MEDIYTVDQYKTGKIRGWGVILKSDITLRLTAVQNKAARRELWTNSIKVKVTTLALTRDQVGCLKF